MTQQYFRQKAKRVLQARESLTFVSPFDEKDWEDLDSSLGVFFFSDDHFPRREEIFFPKVFWIQLKAEKSRTVVKAYKIKKLIAGSLLEKFETQSSAKELFFEKKGEQTHQNFPEVVEEIYDYLLAYQ
jgi:hypothetical protein